MAAPLSTTTNRQGITRVHCKCSRKCRDGSSGPRICRANCSHPDRYSVRKRMPNGRQHERWFGSMAEAERYLADLTTEWRAQRVSAVLAESLFADVAERWLKVTTLDLEDRTRDEYERIVRTVLIPALGDRHVHRISQDDVQDLVGEWSASLAAQTVRNRVNVLIPILRYAGSTVQVGKSKGGVVLPKQADTPINETVSQRLFLQDVAELRTLTDALPERYRLFATFSAMVGTRVGETLELRWSDIINGQRVQVSRAAKRLKGGGYRVGRTKTHRNRIVWVPPLLLEAIRASVTERHGGEPPADALLFADDSFGHLDYWQLMREWRVARQALPERLHKLRIYDLRHTCASMLANRGASILVVAQQLGHSDPSITATTYAHLFPSTVDALMGSLDADVSAVLERAS